MMKNLIVLFSVLSTPGIVAASEMSDSLQLSLSVGFYNPTHGLPPHPKSPIQVPLVYQNGNELTFGTPCNCTLQLLDADGEVVYVTTLTSATTSILLPVALVGSYELRLVFDNYYFYADITL